MLIRPFTRLGIVVVTLVVSLGVAGPASSSPRLRVVAAERQYAVIAEALGGRYVHVTGVLSNPSTDPHAFEVSSSIATDVAAANLVIVNGVGYDSFMHNLESASPNATRVTLSVQRLNHVSPTAGNPHLWYSLNDVCALAKAITSVYERDVPSASLYFQKRLSSLTVGLSRVEVSIYRFRKRFKGRSVAVTEPVADYLLKSLGLRIATPFRLQSTIMNGVDPSPENIAYQEQLLLRRRVGALVYNTQVTSQATTLFREDAQQAHVPVVGVYEIMPSTFSTYQQWMVSTIASIARALTSNHQRNLR